MVHALEGGTIVAVLAASVGWFVVLRRQSFAGHTLSLMAFPGAAGAALAGWPATLGYYVACGAAALAIAPARAPRRTHGSETAAIGTVQASGLALGFLFLSLNHAILDSLETLLFGNPIGISSSQVLTLGVVAAGALGALALVARPLLFATIDPEVARSRGVPVRLLDALFLLILAVAVAATSQVTGILLVFALLVAPPATAQLLTKRMLVGWGLSIALALAIVWAGLVVFYYSPYPAGFYITSFAFGLYALVRLAPHVRARLRP
jgi:zinc/manganese transport system permease protein